MGMRKHDAQPTPDTMTRERDHAPVDGSTPDDRPLLARCQSCRRQIRIAAAPGSVWKHTAPPRGTTGRPANRNHQGPAMQPANTQPATRPPTWADQQLAALRARFPDWDFWYVPTHCGPAAGTWCARPNGAMIATCHGYTPDEIARSITEFEARLPEHIETARTELQAPRLHDDRRRVLERQLAGMTRLRNRSHAATERDAPP